MKTRFCPSPTGNIHIGNARTALFSALLAKHGHGKLLLRIEDTDQERSQEVYTQQLLEDLSWLGAHWDEGPEVGGEHGPYWQSQRQPIYDKYYDTLKEKGLVYPCFCTAEQLAISRKIQRSRGLPPRYAGTCRNLTETEVQNKLAQGLVATLRFVVTPKQTVQFHDLVKGKQRFNTDDIGDFIIRRADGTAPFLYCNAIDDALMDVTHVLRGEDHLTNTPRQLLILEALELPIPEYGHISLILGNDGSPLSKRHGSRSIKELREMGYLAQGIVNYLARLGHYYAENDYLSFDGLAEKFNTENLSKSPARYDAIQLDYWQKEAVMHLDEQALWQWLGAEVQALIPKTRQNGFVMAIRGNIMFPPEALAWAKIFFTPDLSFDANALEVIREAGADFFHHAIEIFKEGDFQFTKICELFKEKLQIKGKNLYQPLRIALTGQLHGPELARIIDLLGQEHVIKRLETAENLSSNV